MTLDIVIAGHGRHGKDTLAEYLLKHHQLTFSSSSWMACQLFIFETLRERLGYSTIEQCYDDRENHRDLWYNLIVEYNTPDLARLGKDIFMQHSVYCGIRNKDELDALKAERDLLVIWVDASKRKPLEPISSMTVTQSDADIFLDNNGTLEDFHRNIHELVPSLGI